jgi:hypothetical protein
VNNLTTEEQRLSQLKQYLQDRADLIRKLHSKPDCQYAGFEELVLDCGTTMEAKPLPKNIKRGLPKCCYWNSQQLAFKRKSLIYVEGYALAEDVPMAVAHAWLLTPEGYAIDPTWETPGICYLGVPFSTEWVKSVLKARKKRGRGDDLSIFECNYLEEYSLLKQGLPTDAYFKSPGEVTLIS